MHSLPVFRRAVTCCLLTLFVSFICACNMLSNSSTKSVTNNNPPPPLLIAISPNVAAAGSSALTLTVAGGSFQSNSVVMWNGAALPTTFTSGLTLTAQVPASDLKAVGSATVTVMTPAPGGGTSNGVAFTIQAQPPSNPVPSLISISPNTAAAGSSATTITATGSNFIASSTIQWNGSPLTTTYTNSTTLTAQVPASDLATAGTVPVTVVNPAPGGGTSSAVNFTIGTGAQVVTALTNSLAWDPVNQVIYLSLPSTAAANGNSVQVLDPTTATLGAAAPAGSEPNLLSVSATSQLLYVSQLGASTVEALTLPGLASSGTTIQLGSDPVDGPFYAMDLQAAPNADGTVTVVRATPYYSPEEEGGVVIYDSGTARANVICGWIQSGCPNLNHLLMDSIQWKSDGTEMFASNNESSGFDFYTALVDTSGFGTVTDYAGLAMANGIGYFSRIHYDATTGYVYGDDGAIIDPSNGTRVGTFAATGLMVPDGTLGAAFFLGQTTQELGTTNFTLESFDIGTFVPIDSYTITNVIGKPVSLIRWGTSGLAFNTVDNSTTPATGAVYLVNGSLVGVSAKRARPNIKSVHRTWKQPDPLHSLRSAKETGISTE